MLLAVEHLVPQSVQLFDFVVVGQGERVSTLVTLGVLLAKPVLAVERLDKVTHIVNDEAKGVALGHILVVFKFFHQESVHVAFLVSCSLLA